jgi:hypothetical protein
MLDPRTVARSFQDFTRAPLNRFPQAARDAWLRALSQLRVSLDLPSRHELTELAARLEALDARLGAIAAEQLTFKSVAPLPAPAAIEAAADLEAILAAEAPRAPEAAVVAAAPEAAADADPESDTDGDGEGDADEDAAAASAPTGQAPGGNRRHRKARKNNRR